MEKSAIISDCKQYRYRLERTWDKTKPKVLFLMLNPSTADSFIDDPTIRRCIGFARSWNYGGILVGNLFAFRATDPKTLLNIYDPIGEDNQKHLKEMYNEAEIIITAWGNSGIVEKTFKKFKDYKPLEGAKELYYLELSKTGTPKHPLYLKKDLKPIKFEIPKRRNY